jgi:hypothetical protein
MERASLSVPVLVVAIACLGVGLVLVSLAAFGARGSNLALPGFALIFAGGFLVRLGTNTRFWMALLSRQ